jgi:hypothetical protein
MNTPTRILPLLLLAAALAGCSDQPAQVRRYSEIVLNPVVTEPSGDRNMPAGSVPVTGTPAPTLDNADAPGQLGWTTPPGWAETKGSGMRLATFTISREGASHECTLIALGPESGEPVSNLKRWIEQLDASPPADEALAAFIQAAPKLPLAGGRSAAVYDLTPFAKPGGKSMLTAIADFGNRVVFVKLTAPPAVLAAETDAFRTLTSSLHE